MIIRLNSDVLKKSKHNHKYFGFIYLFILVSFIR